MSQLEFHSGIEDEEQLLYADVVLPIPIPQLYTYRIPIEFKELAQTGIRVIVQFGRQRVITGIIDRIHYEPPNVYAAKPILDILDGEPVVTSNQVLAMKWMSSYYMCTYGEVVNAGLPSGLKLSSESKIQLHPEYNWHEYDHPLDDKEVLLLSALDGNDSLSYREAAEALDLKSAYRYIKSLVQKELIIIYEEVKERYKPKVEKRVRLHETFVDQEALESLFSTLEKKPKQTDILLKYLQSVPIYDAPESNINGVIKSVFTDAGLSNSSLNTLVKNEIFEPFEIIISRFDGSQIQTRDITLSEKQEEAKAELLAEFETKPTVLLHGITGSGKTEVYISLIQDTLAAGKQVLYLLPEIALTAQIVNRLQTVFGEKMGIYHSKFSDNERVEVWQGLLSGKFDFVIGVRSAVLLPFQNLGLIIVDESHENSYKQFDPAPRYNARDVAIYLGHIHKAKTLLGTATPSVESYSHALQKKFGLVEMKERFFKAPLPEIEIANLRADKKRKTAHGEFTSTLIDALKETLEKKEQAIIFQNRRGYSNYITCDDCGHISECPHCAVSLTYHQYKNQLNCHYCGHKQPVPMVCPACGSTKIQTIGIGTEKIEEELKLILPEARIQRMDLETTRAKYAYQNIINDFDKGNVDILIGTQMVSKGLDFDRVSLVGVFDIDRMMHFPDFRALERTFQLVTQVSGRAGRRDTKGRVIVQTKDAENKFLELIKNHDFLSFYHFEMQEREKYHYPPFARMIHLLVRSKDKKITHEAANQLSELLKKELGQPRVLGPQEPLINKIRDKYLMDVFLKFERKYNTAAVKEIVDKAKLSLITNKELKGIEIIADVDPY